MNYSSLKILNKEKSYDTIEKNYNNHPLALPGPGQPFSLTLFKLYHDVTIMIIFTIYHGVIIMHIISMPLYLLCFYTFMPLCYSHSAVMYQVVIKVL